MLTVVESPADVRLVVLEELGLETELAGLPQLAPEAVGAPVSKSLRCGGRGRAELFRFSGAR
jgi:hypothetical protein